MRRNVWLTLSEWELINSELSHLKYHFFQLNKSELNRWKETITKYGDSFRELKFERVGASWAYKHIKSSRALNVLCRENYRPQDMFDVMNDIYDFIGFIINHVEDVNMNTTLEEWESVRNEMKKQIESGDKRFWFVNDLVKLYHQFVPALV
jgi:hypothetical protein